MQITAVFNSPMQPDYRIFPALLISLLLHTAIIAGVSLSPPEQKTTKVAKSMDVILVNSKSQTRPVDAKVLAQANLDGGGNVAEDRRAKTPAGSARCEAGDKPVRSYPENQTAGKEVKTADCS